jgi:hypothetical protein
MASDSGVYGATDTVRRIWGSSGHTQAEFFLAEFLGGILRGTFM